MAEIRYHLEPFQLALAPDLLTVTARRGEGQTNRLPALERRYQVEHSAEP
jgi:hypothetical protein